MVEEEASWSANDALSVEAAQRWGGGDGVAGGGVAAGCGRRVWAAALAEQKGAVELGQDHQDEG